MNRNSQLSILQDNGEGTTLKNPELIKNIYSYITTEKNNLPSQHNLNNYHYSNEERRRNRGPYMKSENSIMQTGLNCISPKLHNGHYKSFRQNDNGKYKENYLSSAENLREIFDSPSKINKSLKLGLKYSDVPRVKTDKKCNNYRANLFYNGLEKSIKNYKPESDKRKMDEMIDEENDKLKIYMSNLDEFVDDKNEMNGKYPDLIEFQKMNKLKHHNLVLSGNRYMGERFDPLNYDW